MAINPEQAARIVSSFPQAKQASVAAALPKIAGALEAEGILTPKVLAYALATVGHETAGTFRPIEEYGGRSQAKKLGYSGGENYYGRGYIQLTHDYNYKNYGKRIGLGDELAKNPNLALDPDVSAKILAAYMKDRGVAQAVERGDTNSARRMVQGYGQATNKTIPIVTSEYKKILSKIGEEVQPAPEQVVEKTPPPSEQRPIIPDFLKGFSARASADTINTGNNFSKPKTVGNNLLASSEPFSVPSPNNISFASAKSSPTPTINPFQAPRPSTYLVKRGDTPSGIAKAQLGDANRWREIWQGDPRKMPAGATLKIPSPSKARRA